MKKQKWMIDGSYTVEAALIMPMILTIIVIIIYMSFYLHDRAILSSAAYSAALRGSQMINGGDVFSEVKKSSEELIENRLLSTTDITTDISITGKKIKVKYDGTLTIPMGSLICNYLIDEQNVISVDATGEATVNDAVSFIRECRFIENMYDTLNK